VVIAFLQPRGKSCPGSPRLPCERQIGAGRESVQLGRRCWCNGSEWSGGLVLRIGRGKREKCFGVRGFTCTEAADGRAGLCSWWELSFQFTAEPPSCHRWVSPGTCLFPLRALPLPGLLSPADYTSGDGTLRALDLTKTSPEVLPSWEEQLLPSSCSDGVSAIPCTGRAVCGGASPVTHPAEGLTLAQLCLCLSAPSLCQPGSDHAGFLGKRSSPGTWTCRR